MKAKSIFLYFIFIFVFSIILKAEKADDIIGQWYTENNESLVEIYKNNGKYYGKIIWLKEPNRNGKPKLDEKNPDDKLKERPIIGLNILKDFVFDGSNEWNDGKIYDPKSGKTYSCYIKFEGTDKLKIRGYIGISLLGRTTYWTRKK
jgi:uncharacterized protein (DUF2147 family)